LPEDADRLHELFASFGPVDVRRMFGGAGLFADGLMFGLVFEGVVYLKAKADTVAMFEREGCQPFGYGTKTGRRVLTSYWRLPDRLYDDPDELAQWARAALTTAIQSAAKKAIAPKSAARKVSAPKPHIRPRKTSTRKAPA
jgi:DNA transformation protein